MFKNINGYNKEKNNINATKNLRREITNLTYFKMFNKYDIYILNKIHQLY